MTTTHQLVTQFRAARETIENRRRHLQAALLLVMEGSALTPETFAGLSPMAQRFAISKATSADEMSRSILRKSP